MDNPAARARAILEEVNREVRRRTFGNGGPLPRDQASELQKWSIARCTEAIELDPDLAEAYVKRGSDLYFEGRRAESQADMRKAFTLKPRDPNSYVSMSMPFRGEEEREILRVGMGLVDRSSIDGPVLRDKFIYSYWYEGDFTEFVRLLEEWIPELDTTEFQYAHEVQNLAMGYSALGEHARAEEAYRRTLPVSRDTMREHAVEMIIRTRMHRDAFAEAREALAEFRSNLALDKRTLIEASLQVLLDPKLPETHAVAEAALPLAEPRGRRPGPLGGSTSYYSFLLGLVYVGAGRGAEARELLERFAAESAANKREWAVTLRWEIAKAREIVNRKDG